MNIVEFSLDNIIKIRFQDDPNDLHPDGYYNALFDFLGDFDIVQSSELGADCVAWGGKVYELTTSDIDALEKGEEITLKNWTSLQEYKDDFPDFYNWYYNNN